MFGGSRTEAGVGASTGAGGYDRFGPAESERGASAFVLVISVVFCSLHSVLKANIFATSAVCCNVPSDFRTDYEARPISNSPVRLPKQVGLSIQRRRRKLGVREARSVLHAC